MNFLAIASQLLGVLTGARRIGRDISSARDRDKKAAAKWLRGVRDDLLAVAKRIAAGKDATYHTAKLRVYVRKDRIPKTVRRLLGSRETDSVQAGLRRLHDALVKAARDPKPVSVRDRKRLVRLLEDAAGECAALANSI